MQFRLGYFVPSLCPARACNGRRLRRRRGLSRTINAISLGRLARDVFCPRIAIGPGALPPPRPGFFLCISILGSLGGYKLRATIGSSSATVALLSGSSNRTSPLSSGISAWKFQLIDVTENKILPPFSLISTRMGGGMAEGREALTPARHQYMFRNPPSRTTSA